MNNILIQIIGGIGYFLLALSFYKKEKKEILLMQVIAYIFFTIHYYLLNAFTGTICNILGLISLLIIYYCSIKNKKKDKIVLIMIPILLGISILTYQNIYSIFPIISIIISLLSFINDDENIIRIIGIISAIGWLIYAIVYHSYVAIAFEIFTIISTVIAYLKNRNNSGK